MRVWDVLFNEGANILFRVALAIFKVWNGLSPLSRMQLTYMVSKFYGASGSIVTIYLITAHSLVVAGSEIVLHIICYLRCYVKSRVCFGRRVVSYDWCLSLLHTLVG